MSAAMRCVRSTLRSAVFSSSSRPLTTDVGTIGFREGVNRQLVVNGGDDFGLSRLGQIDFRQRDTARPQYVSCNAPPSAASTVVRRDDEQRQINQTTPATVFFTKSSCRARPRCPWKTVDGRWSMVDGDGSSGGRSRVDGDAAGLFLRQTVRSCRSAP